MMQVHKSRERLHSQIGWLHSWHTFSFGEHHDPRRMGFRNLRVINEDRVTAGAGFGTHGHRDMEIVSYVVDGTLGHKDSLGTNGSIVPGDIQRMSAGTGVMHSEMNLGKTAPVHFLQIWILPRERNTKPGYAQRSFSAAEKHNTLAKLATGDGDRDGVHADGSVGIGADVDLYAGVIDAGVAVGVPLQRSRHGFVQVVKGAVRVNGVDVDAGDGVAVSEEDRVDVVGVAGSSEVIVFDLG